MKYRRSIYAILFALALTCASAWADQIIMKDGREYSGKFIRGDANVIEFRILGRVETFKTAEVAQILFKEPELQNPPAGRATSSTPDSGQGGRQLPPVGRELNSQPAARPVSPEYDGGPSATFPAGSSLTIRMEEAVDTDRNRVGDTFRATLDEPLAAGGRTIVPRGTGIRGRIAYARESGRISGQSELILELTEMTANGKTYPLSTSDYSEVGASRGRRTAGTVGGVATLGAVVGAITGGGKGAAIGAATGAAAGTGATVLARGQVLHVPVETILEFKLQKPLAVDVP
jgi:hypothetical protein